MITNTILTLLVIFWSFTGLFAYGWLMFIYECLFGEGSSRFTSTKGLTTITGKIAALLVKLCFIITCGPLAWLHLVIDLSNVLYKFCKRIVLNITISLACFYLDIWERIKTNKQNQ